MDRENRPHVDVIIPARNESLYIGPCLEALFKQDYPIDRLHIYVADASCDDTAAIARQRGATVFSVDPVLSIGATRNIALRQSNSPMVGFLDAHCIAEPGWTAALVSAFDRDLIGGCGGPIDFLWTDRLTAAAANRTTTKTTYEDNQTLGRRMPFPYIPTGNAMFRRTVIDEVGLFEETLRSAEDIDFSWKAVLHGYLLKFVPEAVVKHLDNTPWYAYPRKLMSYGGGVEQLTKLYGLKTSGAVGNHAKNSTGWFTMANVFHKLGAIIESNKSNPSLEHSPASRSLCVDQRFRPLIAWRPGVNLRISEQVLYWFDGATAIIVDVKKAQRQILEGSAGMIFGQLSLGCCRADVANLMARTYEITLTEAEQDLDEFIQELIDLEFLSLD